MGVQCKWGSEMLRDHRHCYRIWTSHVPRLRQRLVPEARLRKKAKDILLLAATGFHGSAPKPRQKPKNSAPWSSFFNLMSCNITYYSDNLFMKFDETTLLKKIAKNNWNSLFIFLNKKQLQGISRTLGCVFFFLFGNGGGCCFFFVLKKRLLLRCQQ